MSIWTTLRLPLARLSNLLLWLSFCLMVGTGLLMAYRLPPGYKGGGGLTALGMDRHEWGDIHFITGWVFLVLIVFHMALHWRWLCHVAGLGLRWPVAAGLAAGVLIVAFVFVIPVKSRGHGRHDKNANAAYVEGSRDRMASTISYSSP